MAARRRHWVGKEGNTYAHLLLSQVLQSHGLAKSFEKSNGAIFAPRRNSTGRAVNVPLRLMEPLCDRAPSLGVLSVERVRAGQQLRVLWGCPPPRPVLDESTQSTVSSYSACP